MCRQMWLASLFTLIVIGAVLGGPLGAAAQTPTPAHTPGPTVTTPVLNYDLSAVWGSSGRDVFVVGDRGTILHYDARPGRR